MNSKSIVRAVSLIAAASVAGQAIATPYPGSSLRINSGSGGTSASYHWVYTDPVTHEPQNYWETKSMDWGAGAAGAYSINETASASLSASFTNLHWDWDPPSPGGWVEFGNPATISGSASDKVIGWSEAHSWANVSFTNTTSFLFSARVTGGGSVSLRGAASFDIVNGQSLDVWLSAGDYSIAVDAGEGGSFFATIPAPGVLALSAASVMMLGLRRKRTAR
jgi:hypothetical protein